MNYYRPEAIPLPIWLPLSISVSVSSSLPHPPTVPHPRPPRNPLHQTSKLPMALILPKHKMLLAVLILKLPDPKQLPCVVLCMGRLRRLL